VEVSNVFERNYFANVPYLINQGGARSTKSWSIGQLLIQRFWNDKNRKIIISRKTGPALYLSAYKLILDLLKDYGYYKFVEHDRTYKTITNPFNNSFIAFLSVDDPEKIKSTEWTDAWLEEATEFTWEDFIIFQTRMSGPQVPGRPNQIILSFNPTDEQGWINQKLVLSPAFTGKVEVIRSTYRDNPFLSKDYIDILEGLRAQDENAARVFADGEYGRLTSVIYPPFLLLNEYPESMDEVIYGLDFGFNVPTALLRIGTKEETSHYLTEKIYQTGLTNSALIQVLEEVIPKEERSCPIYADAAEPDRIEEISRAGFNIHPADKEVKIGIDFCKRQRFYTMASNINLNKERAAYKWRQDKNGNVLDEPVKFMDHLMDAKRYAIYTHHKLRQNQPGIWVIE